MDQKLKFLLDQSIPFQDQKIHLLDELTTSIQTNSSNAKEAHQIWNRLRQDDYFWYNSAKILECSQCQETKVFTLVILEQAIKQKWFALPQDQRENLKKYIVNIVLSYGQVENLSKALHNILSKANSILVQIVKYQWNSTWTSFITDICQTSKKDMNICENNFSILKMLSEEIFDFSKNQMTQQQITSLKQQMVKDFTTIYELCNLILNNLDQAKPSLIKSCLETLHAFLSWIPIYYIIYTDLIDKLLVLLSNDYLRSSSLSCLVEISSLPIDHNNGEQRNKFLMMLKNTTIELFKILPLATEEGELVKLHNNIKKRFHIFQVLARGISNFYSEFFKQQSEWLQYAVEGIPELIEICKCGFSYLIMLMKLDDDQVFKICIEFYHFYIGRYLDKRANTNFKQSSGGFNPNKSNSLDSIYNEIFLEIMKVIARKMAKPEQVLIVIDEEGIPIRQEVENTQNSSLYEIMKELATYLVKYDWTSMKNFILKQIENQNTNFSYDALNSLSWIVGSLCGSILQRQQKNFFIQTLRTLLHLCEMKKGKQNKAVIASCIMYVVGQYPTFLRNNWSFLKTVIRKLFEFMKEEFPGIMDMACNAFLKIVKSTSDQFVATQGGEHEPYIKQVIRRIPEETSKLNNDGLKLVFYESVGHLIGAQKNATLQLQMMKEAEGINLYQFHNIIKAAESDPGILQGEEVKGKLIYFLKINEMFATGIGQQYALLLEELAPILNNLYTYYSKQVNFSVVQNGKNVLNYMTVKSMRSIKKQVIKIYLKYLLKCNNLTPDQANYILNTFIIPLGSLLKDFQQSMPETKEQEFVALFTAVLQKLYMVLNPAFLSNLLDMIFSSSLPLITTDFNSYPQIRANFFSFLKALIKHNFQLLYSLEQSHFTTILECIIWSLCHQLSNYSDLGLELLQEMLINVNKDINIINAFYPKYYLKILSDILGVMTDGFHKSGLQAQTKIFYILIQIITSNTVNRSITQQQNQPNVEYVFNFLVDRLTKAFPNTASTITLEKVRNWFEQKDQNIFKLQIADYLVLINRYTPQEIRQSGQK